jgi:hypothetical protein
MINKKDISRGIKIFVIGAALYLLAIGGFF